MHPTSEEYCDIIDNMLMSSPMGNPTKANMYKTYGYVSDSLLKPFDLTARISRYYGKTLKVSITLSKKGHMTKWQSKAPTIKDIIKALRSIEHGEYHSFAILSKPEQGYIQTNVHALEYQDGSPEEHYFCPPEFLSSDTILKAFISYAQGCSWWKEGVLWKKGYGPTERVPKSWTVV